MWSMNFLSMNQMYSNICHLCQKHISTPHDRIQELGQAIEGLNVDMLQQIVGRAVVKHGLELVSKVDHGNDQRVLEPNMCHLD